MSPLSWLFGGTLLSYRAVWIAQVCDQHVGADGSGGLHDRLPEWSHASQEDARPWLAEAVLPDDRQEVAANAKS